MRWSMPRCCAGNLLARGDFDSLPIPFRAVATDLAHRDAGRPRLRRPGPGRPRQRRRAAALRARAARRPVPRRRRPLRQHPGSRGARRRRRTGHRLDATEHPRDSLDVYSPIARRRSAGGVPLPAARRLSRRRGPSGPARRRRIHQPQFLRRQHRAPDRARRAARRHDSLPRLALPAAAPAAGCGRRCPRRLAGVTIARRQRLGAARAPPAAGSRRRATRSILDLLHSGSAASAPPPRRMSRSGSRPRGAGDSVGFDLSLRRAARRVAGLGLAYDNELGGRMWAGVVDRRFFDLALEGSARAVPGRVPQGALARPATELPGRPAAVNPRFTVRLADEAVRRFDADGDELGPAFTREALGFAGRRALVLAQAGSWRVGRRRPRLARARARNRSTLGGVARVIGASRQRGRVLGGGPTGPGSIAGPRWRELDQTGWQRSGGAAAPAGLGRGICRFSSAFRWAARTGFPGFTSASDEATARRCSACCSPCR